MPSSSGQATASVGRLGGAVRAARLRGAHHRLARLAHHRLHVFEVDVDQARHVDDVADPADRVLQHVVGVREGLVLRDVVAQHVEQLVVQDHDQRVDVGLEFGQARIGRLHAAIAFELERLGDDADGQDAHFLGDARDHRRGAGAGAAAHAGGDEQHVRAVDRLADAVDRFFRGGLAALGLGARAQARGAELDQVVGGRAVEGLRVGVGADELNALDPLRDHVVDRVAAAAAHADHLDLGAHAEFFNHFDGHVCAPVL